MIDVLMYPCGLSHSDDKWSSRFFGYLFRLYKCFRKLPMMEKIKYYTTIIDVPTYSDDNFGIILNEIHRTLRNKLKYITLAVDANYIVISGICSLAIRTWIRKIIGRYEV